MRMDQDYISMGEAARKLKLSKARVSQLLHSGALDGELLSGRRMVRVASIERYRRGIDEAARVKRSLEFTLMSADYEVARVDYDNTRQNPLLARKVIDPARMPFGTVTSSDTVRLARFTTWWTHRSVPDTRQGIAAKLDALGLLDSVGLPLRNLGLSLSDCYWLRPMEYGDLSWQSINYFDNDFEGADSEGWDEWLGALGLDSPDNTSEGELPKRWGIRDGERVLIKGCTTDDQRPFNEAVATALYRRLLDKGEYVPYEVVTVHDGPACQCPNFLGSRQEYIPAVHVKDSLGKTRGVSLYERFARYAGGWVGDEDAVRTSLSKMIVCDAIIANADRHWRNFGFVRSVDTLNMAPAPLFDSGNCLWYATPTERLKRGDYSFYSRPFDGNPERQLALADRLDWFEPSMLDGFVDEAMEILSQSASATREGRLDCLAKALTARVSDVRVAVSTLRHVRR